MTAVAWLHWAPGGGLRLEYEIGWRLRARRLRAGGLWPGLERCVHRYGSFNHGEHQPATPEPAAPEPAAPEPAAAHQRHRDALLAGADHRYQRRPAHRSRGLPYLLRHQCHRSE